MTSDADNKGEREEKILGKIRSKLRSPAFAGYEESMSPNYGVLQLWLDAIIDSLETRT